MNVINYRLVQLQGQVFTGTTGLRWIRHSPDPLDLSGVSQLYWFEAPAGWTRKEHLSSSSRCHSPFHHLVR